ncbi:YopX family protein [Paenibacillus lactis]|uniref:YopX family protein n=1 Tax=Paenibacillus lactis TaxID=228574 RepID=UPI002040B6A2|nr:YopX family protein [Paenibacillus lactis]MCM3492869.1 YopX family protein [Paenibacillus lactis]
MREYKFRGRSIEPLVGDDQWLYGFGVHVVELTDGGKECWLYTENGPYQVDPETVGQYTGLPDRNGKEIYEGDIVRGATDIFNQFTGKVVYAGARYVVDGIGKYAKIREELPSSYEVIGSIYDNPDLLEGGYE